MEDFAGVEKDSGLEAGERQSRVSKMWPCILGMGLFLAWTVGNAYTRQLADIPNVSLAHAVDVAAGASCNVLVLLLVALESKKIGSLVSRRGVRMASGIFGSMGPILVLLASSLPGAIPLAAVGSGMKGACSALLFLMWNELFCRLSIRDVSICYAGAYLVSVIVQALMSLIPLWAAFGCTLLGAVTSVMLLKRAMKHSPAESELRDPAQRWSFPWRPLVMAVAYTFVAFLLRQLLGDDGGPFAWIGGGVVSLVCLVGCILFFDRQFDASVFEFAAMPLIVAGLLLYCWQGESAKELVIFLADAGNVSFRIFILVVLCNICFRYGVPSLWLFAIVRIAMMLAEGFGLELIIWSSHAGVAFGDDDTVALPLCYLMVLVLVVISAPIQQTHRLGNTSWYIVPKNRETHAEQLRGVIGNREITLWQTSQASRLYGLTRREEEVLACLAEGMNRAQIQDELVLSESTVRTHLRHIYAKLDVHTKEDAISAVKRIG